MYTILQTVKNCPNLKLQNFVLFSAKSVNPKCFNGGPGMKKEQILMKIKIEKKEWMDELQSFQ
jgi:hypothetical protein